MDRHNDGSLSRGDFNEYLLGMESLLGLEETRDWVAFSVQLPDRIADKFLHAHVTGAEFMEVRVYPHPLIHIHLTHLHNTAY